MEAAYESRQRTWMMLCHLSAFIVLLGVPLGNILGPFLVWIFRKNEFPLVDEQGKESMNFQISMSLYFVVALALALALTPVLVGLLLYPVAGAVVVADIVITLVAVVKANRNVPYRYPLSLRVVA